MTIIKIIENGPAIIANSDEVTIETTNEITLVKDGKIAICRCSKSKDQPYCDGSHKKKEEHG